jgi:N,N'-diacetyllegionaminate synthase
MLWLFGKKLMARTEIIAEISWNHCGNFKLAEEMIAAAAESGADYAKTQTWKEEKLKPGPWDTDGRRELYRKSQINTLDRQYQLMEICQKNNIKYLTSIFDYRDLDLIPPEIEVIKIPGIESSNKNLVKMCCQRFKKVFLSAAGQKPETILELVNSPIVRGCHLILMHGVYLYPCPLEFSNLSRIRYYKSFYPHVGYSDHTEGHEAPFAALGMGVEVIEKHFTTNNALEGKDNAFSCLPPTLKRICDFRDKMVIMTNETDPDESGIKIYKGRWAG